MRDSKYCIVIADDEKEIRDIVKLLLEGEGYTVFVAENGEKALSLASEQIDLYILDVNMPGISGLSAGLDFAGRSGRKDVRHRSFS